MWTTLLNTTRKSGREMSSRLECWGQRLLASPWNSESPLLRSSLVAKNNGFSKNWVEVRIDTCARQTTVPCLASIKGVSASNSSSPMMTAAICERMLERALCCRGLCSVDRQPVLGVLELRRSKNRFGARGHRVPLGPKAFSHGNKPTYKLVCACL